MSKEELKLAYRTFEGFDRALERQIRHFRDTHSSYEIERRDFDLPALHSLMVDGNGCTNGEWDLFICSTDWLPHMMAAEQLLPLNDFLEKSPPEDWPSGWSRTVLDFQTDEQGNIFGLPYHDGPEMFMYRSDLFEDPEEKQSFVKAYGYPLRPPETWSQFLDVARFFTRPERDLYGCVLAAMPDAHNSVFDFVIHLRSRGGTLLDGRRAVFNRPEGQEALQFLTDLIHVEAVTQPNSHDYESVRSGEYYADGNGAMMWNWSGFGVVADMPPSKIIGRTKFGPIPRGDGPNGCHTSFSSYWTLSIPRECRDPEAAWDFLRSTASVEMDRVTSVEGGIGCRLSTWRDAELQSEFRCYQHIEETNKNVEMLPSIPQVTEIVAILNESIDEVHTQKKSVADALEEAASRVNTLLDE